MEEKRQLLAILNQLELDFIQAEEELAQRQPQRQQQQQRGSVVLQGFLPYTEFTFIILRHGGTKTQAERFIQAFGTSSSSSPSSSQDNNTSTTKRAGTLMVNYAKMIQYIRQQHDFPDNNKKIPSRRKSKSVSTSTAPEDSEERHSFTRAASTSTSTTAPSPPRRSTTEEGGNRPADSAGGVGGRERSTSANTVFSVRYPRRPDANNNNNNIHNNNNSSTVLMDSPLPRRPSVNGTTNGTVRPSPNNNNNNNNGSSLFHDTETNDKGTNPHSNLRERKSESGDGKLDATFVQSVIQKAKDISTLRQRSRSHSHKDDSSISRIERDSSTLHYRADGLLSLKEVFDIAAALYKKEQKRSTQRMNEEEDGEEVMLPLPFLLEFLCGKVNRGLRNSTTTARSTQGDPITVEALECVVDSLPTVAHHSHQHHTINYTDLCLLISRLPPYVIKLVRSSTLDHSENSYRTRKLFLSHDETTLPPNEDDGDGTDPPQSRLLDQLEETEKVFRSKLQRLIAKDTSDSPVNRMATSKTHHNTTSSHDRDRHSPPPNPRTVKVSLSSSEKQKKRGGEIQKREKSSSPLSSPPPPVFDLSKVHPNSTAARKSNPNRKSAKQARDSMPAAVADPSTRVATDNHQLTNTPDSGVLALLPIIQCLYESNNNNNGYNKNSNNSYSVLLSFCTEKDKNQNGFVPLAFVLKGFELMCPSLLSLKRRSPGGKSIQDNNTHPREVITNCLLNRNYYVRNKNQPSASSSRLNTNPTAHVYIPYVELVADLVRCDQYYRSTFTAYDTETASRTERIEEKREEEKGQDHRNDDDDEEEEEEERYRLDHLKILLCKGLERYKESGATVSQHVETLRQFFFQYDKIKTGYLDRTSLLTALRVLLESAVAVSLTDATPFDELPFHIEKVIEYAISLTRRPFELLEEQQQQQFNPGNRDIHNMSSDVLRSAVQRAGRVPTSLRYVLCDYRYVLELMGL